MQLGIPKKIAILCSDDAHHNYLIACMRRFNVAAVVIEPRIAQWGRQTRRWSDFIFAVYRQIRRHALRLSQYRDQYFKDPPPVPEQFPPPQTLTVSSINDPSVAELLRRVAPDLTIVMGTSIIKSNVLKASGPLVVNIHGGYLPYYRGIHCIFFAIYHGDFDKIGSTIHFVDHGVDTGDIIEVVAPPLQPGDNDETLYCRAEKMAIHRLAELVACWQAGKPFPRVPHAREGRLYKARDRKPWHDLILFVRSRISPSYRRKLAKFRKSMMSKRADPSPLAHLRS